MLVLLVVLVSCHVVSADRCRNYFDGVYTVTECGGEGCCLDGGSFTIGVLESEICAPTAVNQACTKTNEDLPTSCLIKVNGVTQLFGCKEGDKCCYVNSDPVNFEYSVPDKDVVCYSGEKTDNVCPDRGDASILWGLDDIWDIYSPLLAEDTFCYEDCYTVKEFTITEEDFEFDMVSLDALVCNTSNVRVCSASAGDTCLNFPISAEIAGSGTIAASMTVTASYCGRVDVGAPGITHKPESLCRDFGGRLREEEFEEVRYECGKVEWCNDDTCVEEEDRYDDSSSLPLWATIIIILLVLGIFISLGVLGYIYFTRKGSVAPADEESPVTIEVRDPRTMRGVELERYLDDAIRYRDMADLKLTIDLVDQEGFRRDLQKKYTQAVKLFDALMARGEADKLRELEEAERKAEEARQALEAAEEEVRRQQEEEEEEALKRALKARDEAKARWMRLWPRLQVLRALNAVNAEVAAKQMEEARKAREEEERMKRGKEEERKKANHCKQLLKHGIDTLDENNLEEAIRNTDQTVFKTTIMQTDDDLKDLYNQAKESLQKLKEERAKQEREQREREEEERRKREVKRQASLARLGAIKAELELGILNKDVTKLESSLEDAEENHLEADLGEDLCSRGKVLLARLQKIEKVKRSILELKRPLIAELKSMAKPPIQVHRAMIGTYLLLGEDLGYLKEWGNVVILLNKTGPSSIKRRVQEFVVDKLGEAAHEAAEGQLLGLTAEEVYEANQAASLFFDWAEMICYEKKQG